MNAIKCAGLATILLGGLFWLQGSSAQAAPYQRYQNGNCANLVCEINFPKVPAGKRLVISNASCYLRLSSSADLYAVQLLVFTNADALITAQTFTPQFVDTIGTTERVYSATHSIFAFANAGQHFQAFAELKLGSISQFACHISGDLQNVP